MARMTVTTDAQWKRMIRNLAKSVRSSKTYEQDFIDMIGDSFLRICKELTPVDSGELRDSWVIFTKSFKEIIIGTNQVEAYTRMVLGVNARVIIAKSGKAMHFFIGGEEFFRTRVEIKRQDSNFFLQGLLNNALDKAIADLAVALLPKHLPFFEGMTPRQNIPTRHKVHTNLSKTVGLFQVTKRNTRRGRGGGVQKAKTGRKSFKRTLSRRRRTGKFITSKNVKIG